MFLFYPLFLNYFKMKSMCLIFYKKHSEWSLCVKSATYVNKLALPTCGRYIYIYIFERLTVVELFYFILHGKATLGIIPLNVHISWYKITHTVILVLPPTLVDNCCHVSKGSRQASIHVFIFLSNSQSFTHAAHGMDIFTECCAKLHFWRVFLFFRRTWNGICEIASNCVIHSSLIVKISLRFT